MVIPPTAPESPSESSDISHSDISHSDISRSEPAPIDAYQLTAALLWQDRFLLLPLMALLLLPQIAVVLIESVGPSHALMVLLLQRATELLFLYVITKRWIGKLSMETPAALDRNFIRYFVIGFLIWLCMMAPLVVQVSAPGDQVRLFFLLLLIPTVALWLRYYFLFFTLIAGVPGIANALGAARSLVAGDTRIPFYTIIAPLGIAGLLYGICYIPAPDGRLAALDYMGAVAAELFWPLTCYLSLGFCFTLLGERLWHELRLDPYRQARVITLSLQTPSFLAAILRPKNGLKLLIIAALIWIGNRIQLETTPPAPSIEVLNSEAENDQATITLKLRDPTYHFRGFQPIHFVLAGPTRHLVSTSIESIRTDGEEKNGDGKEDIALLYQLPSGKDELTLTIRFKTNRSGDSLTALEDLHLWYRASSLLKISLVGKNGEVAAESTGKVPLPIEGLEAEAAIQE